jgi:histidyl-tRNA synthetase
LGSQDAVAAGGRYDNLVAELGGPATPAVGFALGSERVMLASKTLDGLLDKSVGKTVFVAVANESLEAEAFKFSCELRRPGGVSVEGPYGDKSLKSQMKLAGRLNASTVVIFGVEEHARGCVTVRDMLTQQQSEMPAAAFLGKVKIT